MRSHRILPPDTTICELVAEGMTAAEMARTYGVRQKAVEKHFRRLDLSHNYQRVSVAKPTYDVLKYMAAKNNRTPSEIIQTVIDVLLDNHIEEVERVLEVA